MCSLTIECVFLQEKERIATLVAFYAKHDLSKSDGFVCLSFLEKTINNSFVCLSFLEKTINNSFVCLSFLEKTNGFVCHFYVFFCLVFFYAKHSSS